MEVELGAADCALKEKERDCTSATGCQWERDGQFCIHDDSWGVDSASTDCATKNEMDCHGDVCGWNSQVQFCESLADQQMSEENEANTCFDATTMDICEAMDDCSWDAASYNCHSVKHHGFNGGPDPELFVNADCERAFDADACARSAECAWDEENQICNSNFRDTAAGFGGGGEDWNGGHDQQEGNLPPHPHDPDGGDGFQDGGAEGSCTVTAFTSMCSCQKFHVSTRIVSSGHESYECPSLVKLRRDKLDCKKPSQSCQQRAVEVALDTYHHGGGDTLEAHEREAARVFRLAGGLGKSADIIRGLEGARNHFEQTLESGSNRGGGVSFDAMVASARKSTKKQIRHLLPKNNADKLMGGLEKKFKEIVQQISMSHPEWNEQMCHGHLSKRACNRPENAGCSWVYADATCHDRRDFECRKSESPDQCQQGDECYFSESSMECRYESARTFTCSLLDGEAHKCQAHSGCNYDISGDKCMYDCSGLGADACQSPDMIEVCEWQIDEEAQHGDTPDGAESGVCVPSQGMSDGVEMSQTGDFDSRHRPADGIVDEPAARGLNQGLDMEEEETGGGGGAMPDHEEFNPHQADPCGHHLNYASCSVDHRCQWGRNVCSYLNDHRVGGDHRGAPDRGYIPPDSNLAAPEKDADEDDADPNGEQFKNSWDNQHGVRPHAAPNHNHGDPYDDDGMHQEISHNRKTAKGDALFFTFGIIAVLMLIAVSFVSACHSKTVVLGAGVVDFWTAAAFYWVDVRLPYNIDHYEHGGLNYDAFAISCIMVVIFAGARVGSAYTSMKAATGLPGPKRSEFWDRFDVLAMMGLIAQLVVLCIHVITTKHASRTVVCAFIGTITSAVVQAWHLIQDAKSNLGKQT